jgi:DNA-binding GntR family transcriptional regulator
MNMANSSYRFGNPLLGRQSSPELIAESLRQAIIEGDLSPGESLRQENLAKHFAVSRIPVREALRRLESEGWIELQRHRGARVMPLSGEEVNEIYEIRAALEVMALQLAAPRHTARTLKQAAAVLRLSHSAKDVSLYAQYNREFHMALYAPAQRPRLLASIDSLHSQGERYLRLKLGMPSHKQQSDEDHQQIFDAVSSGAIDRAVQILQPHLLQTGELLADYVSLHLAERAVVAKRGAASGAGA